MFLNGYTLQCFYKTKKIYRSILLLNESKTIYLENSYFIHEVFLNIKKQNGHSKRTTYRLHLHLHLHHHLNLDQFHFHKRHHPLAQCKDYKSFLQ
jgi:hypothetical protein